jgi:EAL domain-containing protein (putative c-di-GMP-specific phosphodiesterase class I)
MNEQNENYEIVRTIILLARNLGLGIIAEGVETLEQVRRLTELNCDHGQGYYFSKPVSARQASALVDEQMKFGVFQLKADRLICEPIALELVNSYPM